MLVALPVLAILFLESCNVSACVARVEFLVGSALSHLTEGFVTSGLGLVLCLNVSRERLSKIDARGSGEILLSFEKPSG